VKVGGRWIAGSAIEPQRWEEGEEEGTNKKEDNKGEQQARVSRQVFTEKEGREGEGTKR